MTIKIIKQLASYLKLYKKDLVIVMISLVCVSGSLLMFGYAFKKLVDNGLSANYVEAVNSSISLICLLIIIFGISSFFRSYFINNIAEKVINNIRQNAFDNLIKYPVVYFEDLKIGDVISCLTADIELIARLIIDFLSFFIRNFIMLSGGIIMMFIQSMKLTAIVVVMVPALLVPLLKLGKYVRKLARNSMQLQGQIASNIAENFTNIHTLHAFNQQNNKIIEFKKQIDLYLNFTSGRLRVRSIFFASSISIILLCITIVIWGGSTDILAGNITSGQMVSFIYYSIIAGVSAGGIAELFNDIQNPLAAAERVFNLVNYNNQIREDNEVVSKSSLVLDNNYIIEFNNVVFSYPSRPGIRALDSISFKIPTGKFIGIVGKSGSGKTSIMQLILKFYNVNSGEICIFGLNSLTVSAWSVRNLIAYVPQIPSIFSGTIKSNIAFSNPRASNEEIQEAAQYAGVTEFANLLKDGIDTEIGERGVRLSGGQKQRLALARAILYKPQILLLDEATSSIDSDGEQIVLANIKNLMKGKTIISIAHRISTIEDADKILLVGNGKLLDEGSHSELVLRSENYRSLYEEQIVDVGKKSR